MFVESAAGVATTSGKHTPSELLAQFSAGILSNVSFSKTEDNNKFCACDFCSSVSAVFPFPNFSLLTPFFTFNDVLTFFCNIYFILFS